MASVRTEDSGLSSSLKPLPGGKFSEAEFLAWCDEGGQAEWVDGQVIVAAPPTSAESDLMAFLLCLLSLYVEDRNLGEVFGCALDGSPQPALPARARCDVRRLRAFAEPAANTSRGTA